MYLEAKEKCLFPTPLTNLCELGELCQREFNLALTLSPRGAGWCLACRLSSWGGRGCPLASYRGDRASTRYCCGNCLATNNLTWNGEAWQS